MVVGYIFLKMVAFIYFSFSSTSAGDVAKVRNETLVLGGELPDGIPEGLNKLELDNTGYEILPQEALKVRQLTIKERHLTTISGTASNLRYLHLDTPALTTVQLYDVRVKLFTDSLWANASSVQTLELTRLRGWRLPERPLRGLKNLTSFSLLQTIFTSLPRPFFSDAPKLKQIFISDNFYLKYLPTGVFDNLPELETLVMMNNLLGASDLTRAVTSITSLKTLKLSGNPLGDLCLGGGTSALNVLRNLTILELADIGATHLCRDWLRYLPHLYWLDFKQNSVKTISCQDHRLLRSADSTFLHVDLTKNSVRLVDCSREEYEMAKGWLPIQMRYSWEYPYVQCECGWYWLWRIASESNDTAVFTEADKHTICDKVWMECHPEDELRKFAEYKENEYYKARCEVVPLVHARRPPFPKSMIFHEVSIDSCAPPNSSYVAALRALNISVTKKLSLIDVPADNRFSLTSLADLPSNLQELQLFVSSYTNESGSFGPLNIKEIPVGFLPKNLSTLEMRRTGVRILNAEAVDVPKLNITEDFLTMFNGTASRLKELWLLAPVRTLPLAPALTKLTLYNASPQRISYSALHTLHLHRLRVRTLREGFLRGCSALKYFVATQNIWSYLPSDLFSYSPDLVSVVLSDNMLFDLHSALFANLTKLVSLNLNTNLLSESSLAAVSGLTSLEELDLSSNTLWELCLSEQYDTGYSKLASLHQLKILNLSDTKLGRFCIDWRHLESLRILDLSNNSIRSMRCLDLRAYRGYYDENYVPEINLNSNPLDTFSCTWMDHELTVLDPKPLKKVLIHSNSLLKCNCGNYWLSLILRERNSPAFFNATYESPRCDDMGVLCRMRTFCPLNNKDCLNLAYTDKEDIFKVYGNKFSLRYDNGSTYTAWCHTSALGSPAWPIFPRKLDFASVSLHGCSPPAVGYSAALKTHNVSLTKSLNLYDVPITTQFQDTLPSSLETLLLGATTGVLQIPKEALNRIRVNSLTLLRASGEIPLKLTRLNMTETGLKMLPKGDFKELIIIEKNLSSLPGESSQLESLSISAPVLSLPLAPALSVLELVGAKPPAGFAVRYPKLRTLRLRRLALQLLPDQLLRGATQLQHFVMTDHLHPLLQNDFFSFSLKLVTIDLSDNQLHFLPRGLFSGLDKLEILKLNNNRLSVNKLPDLAPLTALRELYLEDNLLLDLCPDGNTSAISSLSRLSLLHLARSGAAHLCADWQRSWTLRCVDLRFSAVRYVNCDQLGTAGKPLGPFMDLTGSPVGDVDCYDYEWTEKELSDRAARIFINMESSGYKPTNLTSPCHGDWVRKNATIVEDRQNIPNWVIY